MSDQVKEKILINDDIKYMNNIPEIPMHPRIREKQSSEIDSKYLSTGCYRGYIGTWEIKENKLYLKELEGKFELFGAPIFANWVDEVFIIPDGELLVSSYLVRDSIYEEELHIVVNDGMITKLETIDSFKNKDYLTILESNDISRKSIDIRKENNKKHLQENYKQHTLLNFIFISLSAIIIVIFIILIFK